MAKPLQAESDGNGDNYVRDSEGLPVGLVFANAAAARQHRHRVIQQPRWSLHDDETIATVEKHRDIWVARLVQAVFNLDNINDNENSRDLPRFTFGTEAAEFGVNVEASCALLFEAIILECTEGFRGPVRDTKAKGGDEECKCETRIRQPEFGIQPPVSSSTEVAQSQLETKGNSLATYEADNLFLDDLAVDFQQQGCATLAESKTGKSLEDENIDSRSAAMTSSPKIEAENGFFHDLLESESLLALSNYLIPSQNSTQPEPTRGESRPITAMTSIQIDRNTVLGPSIYSNQASALAQINTRLTEAVSSVSESKKRPRTANEGVDERESALQVKRQKQVEYVHQEHLALEACAIRS